MAKQVKQFRGKWIGRRALGVAKSEIGHGEAVKNNSGPDIERYAEIPGWSGNWCAAFVMWCLEQIEPMPFDRFRKRPSPFVAKGLFRLLLRHGGVVVPVDEAMPGDIFCLHRGRVGNWRDKWKGHIGFISDLTLQPGVFGTLEGNVGRAPAKVRPLTKDLTAERLFGIVRV